MGNVTIKRITIVAIMLASLVISAYISIPFLMIPITLQTLVVFLILLLSKYEDGIIITSLYLILGTIGLPIYAGINPGSFASPTYGFIIAFVISSILLFVYDVISLKFKKEVNNNKSLIVKSIIFVVTLYLIGLPYAMFILKNEFIATLVYFLPYIAMDILKIFIAIIIYKRLKNILEY